MGRGDAKQKQIFDYRTLRLLVGLVALILPVVVELWAGSSLSSISASYYTRSRDLFVGLLFGIAALMAGYNGESAAEKWISKVAALAAILVALFPTTDDACASSWVSTVHYSSAGVLFGVTSYFCLVPFRQHASGQGTTKGRRRAVIYIFCGIVIILSMISIFIAAKVISCKESENFAITFIAEWVALWTFGVAWFVAGKVIPLLTDDDERLKLL